MKRMRNQEVAEAWASGISATNHAGNFRTDGKQLWSYSLLIGDTTEEIKVLKEYTAGGTYGFRSQTTSTHVGRARRYAHTIV